jgi:WD40 repeat protein
MSATSTPTNPYHFDIAAQFDGHTDKIFAMDLSSDGTMLASAGMQTQTFLVD